MVALTGTLREQGEALEEKEVALQNVGTALKEREDSLSSLVEAALSQREQAQRNITGEYLRIFVYLFPFIAYVDFLCPELRQKVADESAAKDAVHTALTAAQMEFAELEQTAVSVCQELEGEGAVSGSSVISRLRALGGRVAEYAKSTFRLVSYGLSLWPRRITSWISRGCHRGTSFPMMLTRTPRLPSWMKPTRPWRSSPPSSPRSSR